MDKGESRGQRRGFPAVRAALALGVAGLALSGCGNQRPLKPLANQQLPKPPFGREDRPVADELLRAPVQARPERGIEPRQRSQEREDDPFDLPPEQ